MISNNSIVSNNIEGANYGMENTCTKFNFNYIATYVYEVLRN